MIRSCEAPDGRPGYLWWEAGQEQVTECHPYDPAVPQSRSAAVRAALRDDPSLGADPAAAAGGDA